MNKLANPVPVEIAPNLYWSQKFSDLLKLIGNAGQCRSCQAPVWWVLTKNKKPMPVNPDGEPHWVRCPQASQWRRK